MSKAFKDIVEIVVGIVLIYFTGGAGATLFGSVTAAHVAVAIGVSLVLNGVTDALTPKARLPGNPGVQQEYSSTVAPRLLVFGKMKLSGMNVIPPYTSGTNNQYLHQVLALCQGTLHSITDVYFDQTLIPSADIGTISGADTDGVLGGGTAFNAKAWIRRYDGSQSTVDFILNAAFATQWDTNHKGQGVAYLALRYLWDDAYRAGKPQVTCIVQGLSCYDPRLDSSPGANPTNPTYIAYTVNPALVLAFYITNVNSGLNELAANINWPLVVAAANICDELCAIPGATTQKRFTCNTMLDTTARFEDNIAVLAGAMMGQCIYSGGQWLIYAGAWTASAFALSESDLTGPVSMRTEIQRSDKHNFIRGTFIDPLQNYQAVEFQPRGDAGYEATDGERIQKQVQFAACTDQYEAQRNAIIILKQSRNRRTATLMCGMSAYKVKPWETGTCTLTELGWVNQTVRCVSWKFTPDGQVQVGLREEYSSNWDTPIAGDYLAPGSSTSLSPGFYTPGTVANVTSFAMTDGFLLRWDNPSNYIAGVTFDIYEYTAATPFASASLIRNTAQSSITIEKTDTTVRYYWVVARLGSSVGANYPSVTGVAGGASALSSAYRASASPSQANFFNNSSSGTTNSIRITAVNGTPGYTYSWSRTSGDSSTTISSSTSNLVNWSRTGMVLGGAYASVWRCTITDSASNTTTVDVGVELDREIPGL